MNLVKRMRYRLLHELSKAMTLESLVYVLELKKRARPSFEYEGQSLPYLFHSYNNMGLTERSVEMPIIRRYLGAAAWSRVLEIGNVTNYYEDYFAGCFPNKTVVDKIERAHNVITADIASFSPAERFDFIFSVSTFEHMDSDLGRNTDYQPGRSVLGTVAADNIVHCYENLLQEGGLMVITAPLGYTPEWDQTVRGGLLDKYRFRSRRDLLVSRVSEQEWRQVPRIEPSAEYPYGRPYPYANHVIVLEIRK